MELSRQLQPRAPDELVSDVTSLASAFPAGAMPLWVDVTVGLIVAMAVNAVGLFSAASITLPIIALPIMALSFTFPAGAISLIGAKACVFHGELMTVNAVGLFTPVVPAPADIFQVRDRFQVSGIAARAVLAGMIQFKPLRYRTNEVFINKPVRHVALFSPATTAVTLLGDRTIPQPTFFGLSIGNTFRQQFLNRLDADTIRWHSGNSLFPGCRAGSVSSAYPPIHLTT